MLSLRASSPPPARQATPPDRPVPAFGEILRALLITGAFATVLLLFGPPPGDEPAHLYRTMLIEKGYFAWDNLWYGGSHLVLTYGPLYHTIATVLGHSALTMVGVLASSGAFAALVLREFGRSAIWPARAFAAGAVLPFVSGTFPYSLGIAFALGTLLGLQRSRPVLAIISAAFCLAFSPLAFAFLCMVLVAVVIARKRLGRSGVAVGAAIGVLAAIDVLFVSLLDGSGRYPFDWWSLLAVSGVAVSGAVLAWRDPKTRVIGAIFGLWMVAALGCFVVASSIGENITRLNQIALPLMLLTCVLVKWQPRWLAIVGLFLAFGYNVGPYIGNFAWQERSSESAKEEYWEPAISYLEENHSPNYRIEVVPTQAHWEAYFFPKAGLPLVRGWYRQTDMVRNEVLYRNDITPAQYLDWLQRNGVQHVVLPDVRLDYYTGREEREMVNSAATGLIKVFQTADLAVYRVPDPDPLLTGPGLGEITEVSHNRIRGSVSVAGSYLLRMSWSPYMKVTAGSACVQEAGRGEIEVHAFAAGPFELEVKPSASRMLHALTGDHHCPRDPDSASGGTKTQSHGTG